MKWLPEKLCHLPETSKVSFFSQKQTHFSQVLRIPNPIHVVNVYWPPIMCQVLFLILKKKSSVIAINVNIVLANIQSELKFTEGLLVHYETEVRRSQTAFPSYSQ